MDNLLAKQNLNAQQLTLLNGEYEDKKKSTAAAYLLWFFLAPIGAHRYYLGDIGVGIAMTLTLGGFGIWALIDVFFIGGRLRARNTEIEADLIQKVLATSPAERIA
ncbi:TM2 domain-containing protein [Planococcus sp. APC 3906]|uniref:TM2 domain-containing protein n=1 Tax=Planococcus sp. APC 3906 TaxID=3035194 RepID=UPI0025B60B61|nr:TM2 domain-containing protein [Planococcus sp. APC 3906]MDN3449369.1 TM2 domain-containing protein [Planococcus sp. APC 3906]